MDDPNYESICIVGNSSSLKGRGLGQRIDFFQNVCRINDWVVNGYQQDVGSKITHWVTGVGKQIPEWSKNRSLKDKYTIVLWPHAVFDTWRKYSKQNLNTDGSLFEATPHIKKELLKRLGYQTDEFTIWKDNNSPDIYDTNKDITFVSQEVCHRIAVNTVAYPSTGLATIAYFKYVLRYNVYTIGFDFFLKNKDHYWDGNEGNKCKIEFHSLEKEKQIYDKWIEEGSITEL
jgi:hypothetical protein